MAGPDQCTPLAGVPPPRLPLEVETSSSESFPAPAWLVRCCRQTLAERGVSAASGRQAQRP
eukprot:747254-Hanusia_phi.AAC.11